ncbi:MAG: carbonic anhydrase, partial [Gammaproteobacteria bacterium]
MTDDIKKSISRRTFLTLLPAAAGAVACTPFSSLQVKEPMTSDEALAELMAGNDRYLHDRTHKHDFHVDREELSKGQHPIAAVISCSDSRVVPQFAFDQGPGKLFVVRVAGNVANAHGIASIEYAVKYLKTPLVFVLGHTACGAVGAAIKTVRGGAELPGELPGLVASISRAVQSAEKQPGDLLTNTVYENVRLTVDRLDVSSRIVHDKCGDGKLKLVGGVYDLSTG